MLAIDTSVAVPLLVRNHGDHRQVTAWWAERESCLSGHALPETYSVLTRLPGGLRVAAGDAVRMLKQRFAAPLVLSDATSTDLVERLGALGIVGGAVYDGLVALAALEHGAELATRDARARATYDAVGVRVVVVS